VFYKIIEALDKNKCKKQFLELVFFEKKVRLITVSIEKFGLISSDISHHYIRYIASNIFFVKRFDRKVINFFFY
jgi:hypothetical protein